LKKILNFSKIILLLFFFQGSVFGYDPNQTILRENKLPKELEGIGAKDSLGRQLNTSLIFQDSSGEMISISTNPCFWTPDNLKPCLLQMPNSMQLSYEWSYECFKEN
jgi:protein SCO1/2